MADEVSLMAKVLAGCLDGYKLFTASVRDNDGGEHQAVDNVRGDGEDTSTEAGSKESADLQILLWKFRVQEVRLEMWGRVYPLLISSTKEIDDDIGWNHGDDDDDGDDSKILETLLNISDLLKDYEELKGRYGLELVADKMKLLGISNPSVIQQLITREFERYHKEETQDSKKISKEERFLKKFRWAVKDGLKAEEAVSQLEGYNDALFRVLSIAERIIIRQGITAAVITTDDPVALSSLQRACSKYRNISEIASLRRRRVEIDTIVTTLSTTEDSPAVLPEEMKIDSAKLTPLSINPTKASRGNNRYIAAYEGDPGTPPQTVLVEWKYFTNDENKAQQLSHLMGLARLLHEPTKPAELCVPRCLGYISDEWNSLVHSRVGYVFQWNSGSAELRTLHDLLGAEKVPLLGDRFKLAFRLSKAVSVLHLAGWAHRAIGSQNIVFLCTEGKAERERAAPRLGNAQILGFEYSGPDKQGTVSSSSTKVASSDQEVKFYRYPGVQGPAGERFFAALDIYALGVLLFEIGYWRRISEFWQPGHTVETFHRDLLKVHVPRLGAKVGKMYMDVTAVCLGRECGAGRGTAELQQKFYWDVVRRLSELVV